MEQPLGLLELRSNGERIVRWQEIVSPFFPPLWNHLKPPETEPPALSGTRSNGEVKSRGPRKSLIFGESGGQVPTLLGPPESFARMGKRKNDGALHFEFLEII